MGQSQWRRYCEREAEKAPRKAVRTPQEKPKLKPPKPFKQMTGDELREWNDMVRVGKMGMGKL